MKKEYAAGARVMGSWTIRRLIGEGSYGRVYEIERENFGTYHAALKVITVPQSAAELRNALEEGMDEKSAHNYFYSVVEDIVREFSLMSKLKGHTNIVSYEDHEVIPHQDALGWDILIRMELLTPLLTYAYAHPFSRRDIIRLGIGMCQALELCQKYNIIHRDIKPENIFVSENGDFKLGDFGIARTVEKTMSGLSKKGTYSYMAPEVYRGAAYGFGVDIYSLGIVLYRLLNNNRIPFLPPAPAAITYGERERALARRMGGEAIPPPANSEGRLAEIVQKACAFDSRERYSSPMQMKQELEAILYDQADSAVIYPSGDELALQENLYVSRKPVAPKESSVQEGKTEGGTQSIFGVNQTPDDELPQTDGTARTESIFGGNAAISEKTDATESVFSPPRTQPESKPPQAAKKQKKALWFSAAALTLACVILGGFFAIRGLIPKGPKEPGPPDIVGPSLETQILSPSPDETKIPKVEDGQLVLTKQIKAENRVPLETVRVALVQASSDWPVDFSPSDDSVIVNTYFVEDWLIDAGLIKSSFLNELYGVSDMPKKAAAGRAIRIELEKVLRENDMIVCCDPWLSVVNIETSDSFDGFFSVFSKYPEKEALFSGRNNIAEQIANGMRLPDNVTLLYNSSMDTVSSSEMTYYLLGVAAAVNSPSGIIGVTVTEDWNISSVKQFAKGAASINPDIQIKLYGDTLTDEDELAAFQALNTNGCDVVWCSASNAAVHQLADELGCVSYSVFNKTENNVLSADIAIPSMNSFSQDVASAIQCMKSGWAMDPFVNAPEYVYLRNAAEATADVLRQSRETFVKAYAEDYQGDTAITDYAELTILKMPENPAGLDFIAQPFNGNWLVRYFPYGNTVDYPNNYCYFNMSPENVDLFIANIQRHALTFESYGYSSDCTFSDGTTRYKLHLFYDRVKMCLYMEWYYA